MPGLLDGRIGLVTGAASGIGEAIARTMAEAGIARARRSSTSAAATDKSTLDDP